MAYVSRIPTTIRYPVPALAGISPMLPEPSGVAARAGSWRAGSSESGGRMASSGGVGQVVVPISVGGRHLETIIIDTLDGHVRREF